MLGACVEIASVHTASLIVTETGL